MILSDTVQQHLQRLMRAGMDSGLARLTQLSGAAWQAGEFSLRQGEAAGLRLSPAAGQRHCGAIFAVSGGVFLVTFPDASAEAVARAFFKGFSHKPDAWKGKEPDAVADIANMVVNPVINLLGDAALMVNFLSAPEIRQGDLGMLEEMAFKKLPLREDGQAVRADIKIASAELPACGAITLLLNSTLASQLAEALGA
jgi:hypothetical protein